MGSSLREAVLPSAGHETMMNKAPITLPSPPKA